MTDWERFAGCLAIFAMIGLVATVYFGAHLIWWLWHHVVVTS